MSPPKKNNSDTNLRGLWDNIKWNSICIIGVLKEKERKGQKIYLKKIMAEYLPNIRNETVHEAQRVPSKDEQRDTSRHVANKMKIKRRVCNFKSSKRETTCYIQ